MVPMTPPPTPPLGLCASCAHGVELRAARAVYLRCGRSDADPSYPRYPRLPVAVCRGWEPRPGEPGPENASP